MPICAGFGVLSAGFGVLSASSSKKRKNSRSKSKFLGKALRAAPEIILILIQYQDGHFSLRCSETLRTRRPPTGVFGPEGPEVPLGVSERVSPKIGVCPKVSGEVPLGPF